ncbi:MAG: hypothetical protein GX620_02520 [Chloroflexi bacterium]|nr:hypothetical protein [Chloroflexota bacterium]
MRRTRRYGLTTAHWTILAILVLLDCILLGTMGAVVYREYVQYRQVLSFAPAPPPIDLAPPTLTPAELQYAEALAALVKEQDPAVVEVRNVLHSLDQHPELVFDADWQERTRMSVDTIRAVDARFRELTVPARFEPCRSKLAQATVYYDLAGDVITCGADWGDAARIGRSAALLDLAEDHRAAALQCVKTIER